MTYIAQIQHTVNAVDACFFCKDVIKGDFLERKALHEIDVRLLCHKVMRVCLLVKENNTARVKRDGIIYLSTI